MKTKATPMSKRMNEHSRKVVRAIIEGAVGQFIWLRAQGCGTPRSLEQLIIEAYNDYWEEHPCEQS